VPPLWVPRPKNHVSDDFEIHQLRSVVFWSYAPDFTDFEYPVALFHSQPRLFHHPRTSQGQLLVRAMPAFFAGGSECACFSQTNHEFLVASEWEDRMVQTLWRHDRTFYQTVHRQARFLILARIATVNDWMIYGQLEILANVRVQAHDVDILDSPIFRTL